MIAPPVIQKKYIYVSNSYRQSYVDATKFLLHVDKYSTWHTQSLNTSQYNRKEKLKTEWASLSQNSKGWFLRKLS